MNTLKKIVLCRGKGAFRPLPPCVSRFGKQTTMLQVLLILPCVQILPPTQSLQALLCLLWVKILLPPQSSHSLLLLPGKQTPPPLQFLQVLLCPPCVHKLALFKMLSAISYCFHREGCGSPGPQQFVTAVALAQS